MSMVDDIEAEDVGLGMGFAQGGNYPPPATVHPGVTSITADTGVITAQRVAVARDDARILQRIKALAAMAGEDWYYRFPVKNRKENRTDYIEGPSIKCAMAVARLYGNCSVDCKSVDQGQYLLFLARFVDLETGFQLTRPFQQRKSQQSMRTDADRQADIVYQIGASKAMRNVVCNALETYVEFGFQAAKQNLVEKVGRKLAEYRAKVLERFAELKVELNRVERIIGKASGEWTAPDVARLIAEIQSIQDGMATVDELYPLPQKDGEADKPEPTGSKLDQFNDMTGNGKPAEQENAKPAGSDKSAATAEANATPHDPETGEVIEESKPAATDKPAARRSTAKPPQEPPPSAGDDDGLFGAT